MKFLENSTLNENRVYVKYTIQLMEYIILNLYRNTLYSTHVYYVNIKKTYTRAKAQKEFLYEV